MIARETRLARIDSPGVRLYNACLHFGPGAAKARRAFSFARFLPGDRVPETWLN